MQLLALSAALPLSTLSSALAPLYLSSLSLPLSHTLVRVSCGLDIHRVPLKGTTPLHLLMHKMSKNILDQ